MPAHSKEVIDKFCHHCDWLLQTWQMRKNLFDENPNEAELKTPRHAHFFYRLQIALQESWLLQLAKLHDPAIQQGSPNLSLDYIVKFGEWEPETAAKLNTLLSEMNGFALTLKDARNKVLSHNDLGIQLAEQDLGCFAVGADETYFKQLREFASLVSQAVRAEPFIYDNLVRNDVDAFMNTFLRGVRA